MSEYSDKLKYILVDGQYVSEEDFQEAIAQADAQGVDPLDFLINNQFITEDIFGQAVAEVYGVAYADLNSHLPAKEQILKIPEDVAMEFRCVLFKEEAKSVTITSDVPNQDGLQKKMKELFPKKKIILAFSLGRDIDEVMVTYQKPLEERIAHIVETDINPAPKVIDEIIREALTYKSSDIHIEPRAHNIHVRFRIDGVLQDRATMTREQYESVLNRVKVLSHLRIDEHRSTQDGSIRYDLGDKYIDMRISLVPVLYGEKIVARMLTSYVKGFSLDDLGLSSSDKAVLEEVSKKPFGMVINTGPTGSGKTTTLYSLIHMINKPDVNITTIEDPVEYRVEGLNQIQVDPQRELTFAKGLRSIVRQDPDIILVGEIRDQETAEIAVNAALTGHLLFSTFHANDAATAIPRLLDMGVEPFLLASTLELVLAQRLARKICSNCRYSFEKSIAELKKEIPNLPLPSSRKKLTLYKGKGCTVCRGTGYHGRSAIFEYIYMTPELKDLILTHPSTREIWELASKQGSHSLFADGLEKVYQGVTTFEELLRVAKPPEYE